jgi:coenzyme PQQ precursor peptide PqqA
MEQSESSAPRRPWNHPRFEELCVGLEIGAYAPSELERPARPAPPDVPTPATTGR